MKPHRAGQVGLIQRFDFFGLAQDGAGVQQQILALGRGAHPAAGALKQLHSQGAFQLVNGFAQAGLAHKKIFCGLGD